MWWALLFVGLAVVAILPSLIGVLREVEDLGMVIVLNLLAPITAGGGWIGAMVLACRNPRRLPSARQIIPPDGFGF